MQTSYGTFDLDPARNQARIPYNYGNGPGQFSMNLRIGKSFGIGPKVTGAAAQARAAPVVVDRLLEVDRAARRRWWTWARRTERQRWTATVRSGGCAEVFVELYSHGTKHPEQCESCSAGRSARIAAVRKIHRTFRGFFSSAASNRSINLQVSFNF